MVNAITGFIALAALIVFLGHYVIVIHSLPMWIIAIGVLLLPIYDYWQSLRRRNGNGDANEGGESGGAA